MTIVSASKKRKKDNEKNEKRQLPIIIRHLNEDTPEGIQIKTQFFKQFNAKIFKTRLRTGGDKNPWDLESLIGKEENTAQWKNIEYKGSYRVAEIKDNDTEWKTGVQFKNGFLKDYSFGADYQKKYYEEFIKSGFIRNLFGIDNKFKTPTIEEWKKDSILPAPYKKRSKNLLLKNDFMKEYFKKFEHGGAAKIKIKKKEFNKKYILEDTTKFANEVMKIASKSLMKKDYWLIINGWSNDSLKENFHFKWFPQVKLPEMKSIKKIESVDLEYEIEFNNGRKVRARVRFGRYMCNLRIDLK